MRISEIFQLGYDRDGRDRRRHRHRRFHDYRRRRFDDNDDGLVIIRIDLD